MILGSTNYFSLSICVIKQIISRVLLPSFIQAWDWHCQRARRCWVLAFRALNPVYRPICIASGAADYLAVELIQHLLASKDADAWRKNCFQRCSLFL